MSLFEAIFRGIIQGLTEFLPISSSGHLAILEKIFGMEEAGVAFDVFLHLGTLVAVFAVFWKDIFRLFADGCGLIADSCINLYRFINSRMKKQTVTYKKVINGPYRKFALLVIISTIPTGIIGMLGRELVSNASDTLIIPGICLLITAVLLLMSDQMPDGKKTPKGTKYTDAVILGVCQGVATLPGLSRSGTTITAGILCGLRRDFAVKYSFIMSIPAIIGGAIVEVPDMGMDLASTSVASYIMGALLAGIVGFICIKTMLVVVKNKKFKYFPYYCMVVGMVAIIASFFVK